MGRTSFVRFARGLRGAGFIGAASALWTTGIARFPAGAAEFSYKLALSYPLTLPLGGRSAEAADKINKESGGRLEIKVFPNNQLGSSLDVLSQMRLGAVELCLISDADCATIVPVTGLTGIPFIVANAKEGLNILAGRLGSYVQGSVARVGLFSFAKSWYSGFSEAQNSVRPIATPADIRGLKLRTTSSPTDLALFKALGATPTPLSPNEMYTALQTHLVDGATLSLAATESFKMYEVAKYFSYTNHTWIAFTMRCNAAAWQRLPKNLQDIAARNFEAARNLSNQDITGNEAGVEERLKGHGMLFNNVDSTAFRRTVRDAGLYGQWKTMYPAEAWSLLERSVGTLG